MKKKEILAMRKVGLVQGTFHKIKFLFNTHPSIPLLKAFIFEFFVCLILLNKNELIGKLKYWISDIKFTRFCSYLEKIR